MVPIQEVAADYWLLKFEYINNALPYFSFTYLVVLSFYTVRFVKQLCVNRILQKAGLSKAPLDFRLFTSQTAIHLGITKKIQVWISARVDVPSVSGFIKPVILLPAAIVSQLSIKQVEAILLHELAHVKRNDYLINLLQSFVELIMFFNPFVFLLSDIARKERENCCDDWVLNYRYDHRDYARALLILEEQRQSMPGFALAATNNKKNLLNRIKRLFQSVPQTSFTKFQQLKLASVCILMLIGISFGLPCMNNRPSKVPAFQNAIVLNGQVRDEMNSDKEYPAQKKLVSKLSVITQKSKLVAKSAPQKKRNKKETESPYVNAFINEELLNPNHPEIALPLLASENDNDEIKYLVKIEEQQSGKKQTNTYVFELKSENGLSSIKPLIILNKLKVSLKVDRSKTASDSIVKPIRKRVTW
jgi:bla regulator protein blaR1